MNIHFKDGKPFVNIRTKPANYELEYSKRLEQWQSSSIAIKEPEFTEGETIIEIATQREMEVGVVCGDGSFAAVYIEDDKSYTRTNKSFDQDSTLISHYYEGQQIDENEIEYENIR